MTPASEPGSLALVEPDLPPGPTWPAVVSSVRWMARPLALLDACARRFGDTFTLRFAGYPPMVLFAGPAEIQRIFQGDPDHLLVGPISVLRPILGDNSLFLLDGPRHRAERRLLLPPFHGERLRAYGATMSAIADASVDRWPIGPVFRLHPHMQDITLEVILRTVFGLSGGPRESELGRAVLDMLAFSERPALMLLIGRGGRIRWKRAQERLGRLAPWPGFQAAIDRVDALLLEEILRRREAGEEREDVLSLLLGARDEAGRALSDEALRDEMKTLLVAGHETTATSLTFTLMHLGRDPELLRRLRTDIDAGQDALLDAVVKESLRLHPLSPLVARSLAAPMEIGGRVHPAGITVVANIYAAHRRAAAWPDPERFVPERFLGRGESPYEFLPFGGGTRRCLGMAFALFEMRVVLRRIVRRATLALAPGYRPRLVRRGTTLALSEGAPFVRTA